MTTNYTVPDFDPEKMWLVRIFTLAMIIGGWLLYAHGMENGREVDELRARGQTTTAQARKGLFLPEEKGIVFQGRSVALKQKRFYTYTVGGKTYEHSTTGEEDPVGQTITYLPDDPNVHRVGEIEPKELPWWKYVFLYVFLIFLAAVWGLLTFAFFGFALLPYVEPEPSRAGWWCIAGLAAIQFTVGLVATTFFQIPFAVLLTQGVPVFVGGTFAAIAGVRLFAWSQCLALQKPDESPKPIPVTPVEPVADRLSPPELAEAVATSAVPAPSSPRPITEEHPIPTSPPVVISHRSILVCPICSVTFVETPDAKGASFVSCPRGHWFPLDGTRPTLTEPKADQSPCYFVVTHSGGEFVGRLTVSEIRFQLTTGGLRPTYLAAESDGRSYNEVRHDAGLRWRSLANLLAEWGETMPSPRPAVRAFPWRYFLLAMPAGASGCVALSIFAVLMMHLVAAFMSWCGSTASYARFGTSRESIAFDVIFIAVAGVFGIMRGMVHQAEWQRPPPNWREFWLDIAGKSSSDLCKIKSGAPFAEQVEMLLWLFFAMLFTAPAAFFFLVWFSSSGSR